MTYVLLVTFGLTSVVVLTTLGLLWKSLVNASNELQSTLTASQNLSLSQSQALLSLVSQLQSQNESLLNRCLATNWVEFKNLEAPLPQAFDTEQNEAASEWPEVQEEVLADFTQFEEEVLKHFGA